MPLVENKAANAIQAMKSRRYSLSSIARWVLWERGVVVSVSSLSRISKAERAASDNLEKALVAAAKAMK